jgi:NADH:ubiquinone oxidoreductase subunit F (NADH-binding)
MHLAGLPPTLPRLLVGIPANGPMSLAQHEATHGTLPAHPRRSRAGLLADELARAGLRGHGGAGFPTAVKLRAVAGARGRPVVVANGCEGEPASRKDRLLVEHLPHLVIDGALLAAAAIGARDIVIAVNDQASRATRVIEHALSERRDLPRGAPRVRVVAVPHGYVSGQETALVSFLNGGPARPMSTPPPVFEKGVSGRPTLVDNVETLAQVALIARHGSDWYRQIGTAEEPGSRLVTVSGGVARPGVFEIESGTPLRGLIEAAGGLVSPARAFLFGGYAGTWVPAEEGLQMTLSNTRIATVGATLGAGIVVVLPSSACVAAEIAHVASWLSAESAQQCGPCINGLSSIAATLEQVQRGEAEGAPLQRLARWASVVRGRGACAHPDGVARVVSSALEVFAAELDDHARHGLCDACARRRVLPVSIAARGRLAA